MSDVRYSMSFTTGGLFRNESLTLIFLYLELSDWDAVRDKVCEQNILQARTINSLKRVTREIISRLKTLSINEIKLLSNASRQEQGYLLWLAVCRRYRFIADFSIEVLHERYISLKTDLTYNDFDSFFNKKSEWHTELEEIRPATRQKLRQVLFKMLREADLLTSQNIIIATMLSRDIVRAIPVENRRDILCFPIFESDLKDI
jgi:hypothetical protein